MKKKKKQSRMKMIQYTVLKKFATAVNIYSFAKFIKKLTNSNKFCYVHITVLDKK